MKTTLKWAQHMLKDKINDWEKKYPNEQPYIHIKLYRKKKYLKDTQDPDDDIKKPPNEIVEIVKTEVKRYGNGNQVKSVVEVETVKEKSVVVPVRAKKIPAAYNDDGTIKLLAPLSTVSFEIRDDHFIRNTEVIIESEEDAVIGHGTEDSVKQWSNTFIKLEQDYKKLVEVYTEQMVALKNMIKVLVDDKDTMMKRICELEVKLRDDIKISMPEKKGYYVWEFLPKAGLTEMTKFAYDKLFPIITKMETNLMFRRVIPFRKIDNGFPFNLQTIVSNDDVFLSFDYVPYEIPEFLYDIPPDDPHFENWEFDSDGESDFSDDDFS